MSTKFVPVDLLDAAHTLLMFAGSASIFKPNSSNQPESTNNPHQLGFERNDSAAMLLQLSCLVTPENTVPSNDIPSTSNQRNDSALKYRYKKNHENLTGVKKTNKNASSKHVRGKQFSNFKIKSDSPDSSPSSQSATTKVDNHLKKKTETIDSGNITNSNGSAIQNELGLAQLKSLEKSFNNLNNTLSFWQDRVKNLATRFEDNSGSSSIDQFRQEDCSRKKNESMYTEPLSELDSSSNSDLAYNTSYAKRREDYTFNKQQRNKKKSSHCRDKLVPIGEGNAKVPAKVLREIVGKSHTVVTRKLLTAVFPRSVLATHSLTGKPSPAFPNKPAKKKLNSALINDIISTVMEHCNTQECHVRTSITTKCADEAKMYRNRQMKTKAPKVKKENIPPETYSDYSEYSDD